MTILVSQTNAGVYPLLIKELQKRIPYFNTNTLDDRLAVFAQRDLETFLEIWWELESKQEVLTKLKSYLIEHPEDTKIFLSFWVDQWLAKWRKRVKILHKKTNKVPESCQQRFVKARILYWKMDNRKELKKMVVRKLVKQGEICMTRRLAENLIISEIIHKIQGGESKELRLNPVEILNNLSRKILRLHQQNGVLIYLRVKLSS